MFCKTVILKISCNQTPCQLTILSNRHQIIRQTQICDCCTQICFCTTDCMVELKACSQGQTICKIICLKCQPYQCICVNLNFSPKCCLFTLQDKFYNLPIPNAILNFTSQSS